MRYSARSHGIKEMRTIFKRARNMTYCTWQVIVASAFLEYHRNAETNVAKKLFSFACQSFPDNPAPLLVFADWLLGVRDDTNLTSTLVTAVKSNSLSTPAQRRIADKLADVYALTADLTTLQAHEATMDLQFGTLPIDHARSRYRFLNLDLVSIRDLGQSPLASALASSASFTPGFAGGLGALTEDYIALAEGQIASGVAPTSAAVAVSGSSDLSTAQNSQDSAGTSKRRILDEWVPKETFVNPDITSGRGWAAFRPSKMSDDEERVFSERHKCVLSCAQRVLASAQQSQPYSSPDLVNRDHRDRPFPHSSMERQSPIPQIESSGDIVLGLLKRLPPSDCFTGKFYAL
jgi:hypothetical protein